jgi:hypothetical protein
MGRLGRVARRAFWLLVGAMLLPAQAAWAQDAGRVIIVAVDGTTLGDWSGLPAFRAILDEGSVAVLSTRTPCPCDEGFAARASAYRTFANLGGSLLGEQLRAARIPATVIGDANGLDGADLSAAIAIESRDGTVEVSPGRRFPVATAPIGTGRSDPGAPGNRRTDFVQVRARLDAALGWARLVIVDLGDTERADRTLNADPAAQQPWVKLALRDADRFLGGLRASLRPSDVLIVVSIAPPLARASEGIRLGAVAASGLGRGLLASETTRRAGMITIADLAATVADRFGIAVRSGARGRPVFVHADRDAPAAAGALERDVILAHRSRVPGVRTWMWSTAALIALAFTLVVAGRGRRPGVERFPRHSRDLVATGLVAVAIAPAAMLLAPVFTETPASAGWLSLALAIGLALTAHLILGHERALLAGLIATGVVLLGDTLAGGPLALRSAIGPQIAPGLRLAGTSETVLAVVLIAPFVVAGLALDRTRHRSWIAGAPAAALTLAVLASAAPTLGARIAAPAVGIPAIAVLLAFATGRAHVQARHLHAIVIASLMGTGLAAAVHLLRDPPPPPSSGLGAWYHAGFATAWLATAIAAAGVATSLLTRRRALTARAYWGRPYLRATLVVAGGIAAALLVAGSGGVESAATAAALTTPAFLLPFLAPD